MAEPMPDVVTDLREVMARTQRDTAFTALPHNSMEAPATISAADLMAKVFPEPKWAVQGLVPEGATLLVGAPKKGKSWLVLGLAVAVAAGGMALSKVEVEAGPVLYLALEDGQRRLQERLERMLGDEPPPADLWLATEWPRVGQGGPEALDAWLTAHPTARLVVVDTLAKLRADTGHDRNLYQADYAAMGAFKQVADKHSVALVVVHHTRKAEAEDPLESVSGTNGLTGAADTILVLRSEVGRADAALYLRGRDVAEADHALSFDPATCTWHLLGDAAEYRLTEGRAAVLKLLASSATPMTPKQISEVLGGDRATIRKHLRRMAEAGQVVSADGKYHLPPATGATPATPVSPATGATGQEVDPGQAPLPPATGATRVAGDTGATPPVEAQHPVAVAGVAGVAGTYQPVAPQPVAPVAGVAPLWEELPDPTEDDDPLPWDTHPAEDEEGDQWTR